MTKRPCGGATVRRWSSARVCGRAAVRLWVSFSISVITLLAAATAQAQQERLRVLVEFIAGANIYINAGTDRGIATSDTLWVYGAGQGALLGALRVLRSSEGRSVVTFAGQPFPITRGESLDIVLSSTGLDEAERRALAPNPAAAAGARTQSRFRPTRRAPRVSGRLSFDMRALRSTSRAREIGPEAADRYFTTPAARLRMAVSDLPGGITFRTNLRASARYSSDDVIDPVQSFRVYEGSLEKSFDRLQVPVQLQVGRFYNRYETYSGYWDGVLMRAGGRGFGGGFVIGFQPERLDEGFNSDLPKASAFVDYSYKSGPGRYQTDLSVHHVRPQDGRDDHTFIGWTQRARWRRFRASQHLQLDRAVDTGQWAITQLLVSGAAPIGRGFDLHARYALRRPSSLSPLDSLIATRRDQGSVGVTYLVGGGSLGFDVTATHLESRGETSYAFSPSASFPRTAFLSLGISGSVSYWMRGDDRTIYVSGGLSRNFGRVQARAFYHRYDAETTLSAFLTHTGEISVNFPVTRNVYSNISGRIQRGSSLNSEGLYASLWMRL